MKRTAPAIPATAMLAALSEPVRVRIVRLLEAEELSVGEVASVVQLPQSTVSRHLKVLAEAGWLARRAAGTATCYRVVLDDLQPFARAVWVAMRDETAGTADVEEDNRRLAAVLAERPTDSQAFFGRIAGEWDNLRRELFGDRFTPLALLSLLPREWTIADLGCGTANAAEWLAPRVGRVVAVDRSEAMLDAARKRLGKAKNVQFKAGDLERLPLAAASVDACVCVLVLHHLPEPEAALREMARVLRTGRRGGAALIVDMVEHGRTEYRHTMGHAHLGFSASRVREMYRGAGFEDVRVESLAAESTARGPGLFAAVGWKKGQE